MPTTILFICTGNSCRSQMAEGFARAMLPAGWRAYSAGTKPGKLNPNAVKVMAEVGIDISGQYSKALADIEEIPDIVVTLCDSAKLAPESFNRGAECPVFPGAKKVMHWGIEDPFDAKGSEEEVLNVYRRVRDEIKDAVAKINNI